MTAGLRILAALLALATPATAQSIIIGTAVPYPRVLEHDGMGNVSGLEGDLIAAICDRADWDCTWEVMDFDTLFPALEAGRIDIAANFLGRTPERAERVHMTCPYLPDNDRIDGGTFFVADPATDPHSGPVAALRGSLFAETLADLGLEARLFATEGAAIDALLAGEVPAFFGARRTAMLHPQSDRLINAGVQPSQIVGIAFAVTPTRPDLGRQVDAHLADLSREGTITALLARWVEHHVDDPIALCEIAPPIS